MKGAMKGGATLSKLGKLAESSKRMAAESGEKMQAALDAQVHNNTHIHTSGSSCWP